MTTFYVREETGFREARGTEILTRAQALVAQRFRAGSPAFTEPHRTADFLRLHVGSLDYEVFGLLHLDARHRLIALEDLFRGTLTGSSVHIREVVKSVLSHQAAAVILFHNHPSGHAEPSDPDHIVTRRIRHTLDLIDVRVLDHLIVGETIYSFRESGLL